MDLSAAQAHLDDAATHLAAARAATQKYLSKSPNIAQADTQQSAAIDELLSASEAIIAALTETPPTPDPNPDPNPDPGPGVALPLFSLVLTPNWVPNTDEAKAQNHNAYWTYTTDEWTYAPPNGKDAYRTLLLDPRSKDSKGKQGIDEWCFIVRRLWPAAYDSANHGKWGTAMNLHNTASADGNGGGVGWGFGDGVSALALGWLGGDPSPCVMLEPAKSGGMKIQLPVVTRDHEHEFRIRWVAGRTDGSTARPGEIDVWADGGLVTSLRGLNTVQRAQDPTTGQWWTQRWASGPWDGDYTSDLPVKCPESYRPTQIGPTFADAEKTVPTVLNLSPITDQVYRGAGANLGAPTLTVIP